MKGITTLILFNGLISICFSLTSYSQTQNKNDYLVSFTDTVKDEYGYRNKNGDTIIPLGKYSICFTDTFRTFAIVSKAYHGFVAIDRQENILYNLFPFDNGPDNSSNGLFRIIQNNKIGYADSINGEIIIRPQFDCAYPFKNGIAKVSNNCHTKMDGEYHYWVSDIWYYIDKSGNKIKLKN